MATGGAARVSVKGSDEFHLFTCSPCSKKDIDVGAEVYCLQCQEYLCGTCHSHHNKFKIMASHTMLDRAQMEAQGPQGPQPSPPAQPLLTVPCDLHPGERYTLFCGKHDQVCCAVCSRIYHKSCDVRYILDVAKGAKQGPELNSFRQAVKDIMKHLEKVKKQRELDVQRMTTEKTTETDKIQTSVRQMIKQFEELEKAAIKEVTRKFTEFKTNIESDLANLNTMISTLNTKLDKLEKANDETEKFVHRKICKDDKSSAMILIKDIEERVGEERLEFLVDERVEETIRKLESLGELVMEYRHAPTLEGQHSVDAKEDGQVCIIMDICFAQDGSQLMTDFNNQCLKRLDPDQNYRIIDRLKLADGPVGVCPVSIDQAAVCLMSSATVQLIALNPTMRMSRSFKTTDVCSMIAYHDDHLYVTCGGWREANEGPGHIAVYTISGELIRKLETDSRGPLFASRVLGVAVRKSDDIIVVCDRDKGLVALSSDGQRLWTRKLKDLDVSSIGRVTLDTHGHALVSSLYSSKVVMVSKDGRKLAEVLTARDGINKPSALCFDMKQSHLILAEDDNNQISVFKLTKAPLK